MACIRAIKDVYDGAKTVVETLGGDSAHFPIVMELHQRSTLAHFICLGDV